VHVKHDVHLMPWNVTDPTRTIRAMPPIKKLKRKRASHFLLQWRNHRGLTQEQLAERIEMSRENYSKIERGLVPYNQDFLEAVAEALACEPADLIMRDPSSPIWSIYDTLRSIPEDQQRVALTMLEALRKAS
jgi:transcriptional regulator with XRE-family HTH domain